MSECVCVSNVGGGKTVSVKTGLKARLCVACCSSKQRRGGACKLQGNHTEQASSAYRLGVNSHERKREKQGKKNKRTFDRRLSKKTHY